LKTAIVAVSRAGIRQACRLKKLYPQANIYVPGRFIYDKSFPASSDDCTLNHLSGSFSDAVGTLFNSYRLLIFISAVAVAVRAVAPFLKSKDSDPAIVVLDEQARFAISLLSGHLGGANEETAKIATHMGARPVITTATDSRGLTAFDDLARRLGWKIENLPDLKAVSAALLEEREIILYSDYLFSYPLQGKIRVTEHPELLKEASNGYILISSRLNPPYDLPEFPRVILRPPVIAAGVGCRRGVEDEKIIEAVKKAFNQAGLALNCLSCLASGEFKADEEGLIKAAAHFAVPLKIFTRDEIRAKLGDTVPSAFVNDQVGVGAVAEPCARLGSGGGKIILPTQSGGGITVALAEGGIDLG
jgi:cobalt-precorrin 5A hydrolase